MNRKQRYVQSRDGRFEWTATFINLNKGKNDALLEQCKPLGEYMFLVNCIRENEAKGMPIEDAIDTAVQHCIDCNVLKEFLVAHRAEVVSVCLTEFNEEVFVNSIRAEGELSMLIKLVKKGHLPLEKALSELQMSAEEFTKLLEKE